jgi:hypothetical protein
MTCKIEAFLWVFGVKLIYTEGAYLFKLYNNNKNKDYTNNLFWPDRPALIINGANLKLLQRL